jgi:hypothetical protein
MFEEFLEGSEYLLSCNVEGRDSEFSENLALLDLSEFSSVIHFMVGRSRSVKNIELFEIVRRSQKRLTLSHNQGKFGIKQPDLEDRDIELGRFFLNKKLGNDKIWRLMGSINRSKMEDAIILAVEWIGKAAADQDLNRAFVQCIFAIEALLVRQPEFISPSIAQQIREGCAFLLQRDPKKRLLIDSDIPKVYKIRSQIVHGHDSSATSADVSKIFNIARSLIYHIINHLEFSKWSSPDDLADWIKKYKYNARKRP